MNLRIALRAPRPCSIASLSALGLLFAVAACDPREIILRPELAHFDGTYRGTTTSDQAAGACGNVGGSIKLEVSGGQIAVQTHRHSGRLLGTVGPDGEVFMQNADASRVLTGSIQDGVLSAVETTNSTGNQNPYASAAPPCSSTIRATRAP